ncbi:MAG: hypothetical protein K1X50_04545 [Candidatus Promineofilum sp.]|nr:hypothetical protein [Promineifilum sp.]
MKIAELVTLDDKAEFRSDVQLDAYDRPEQNLALLHSYLFSSAIPARSLSLTRDISAVGLLKELVDIYLNERNINRLCLIANYGHGKSHLALALANYFGRAVDSPELGVLYPKIAAAIDDPAGATRYQEFKKNRGEFLLIRLRGDVPQSLHAQFLLGLSRGLAEHEATRGIKPPFWYQEAMRLLAALSPQEAARANEWLAQRNRDLALLRLDIETRKDVFDETVGALEAAKGMKPALSEVALAEALRWAADEVVGQGLLGGILVLFDEFSLYVERYGHRTAPAELQDLLNGIDNLRGRAVFLAFAQADPDTTADNLHSLNHSGRASLKKALTRLEGKRQLSTLLESVIDAYLTQRKGAWDQFVEPPVVRGRLFNASDVAFDRFSRRYRETLRWSTQTFQEKVTKGCFPLHPITTYLLCNMTLGTTSDAGSARTMLGFVREYLQEKQSQPAVVDGRPNWVLPVDLIDYFEARFSSADYTAYRTALTAAGPDASPGEQALLKALLLQQLAGVTVRLSEDQRAFLAQCAGLSEDETKRELRALSERNVILWNPDRKTYSLFPVTANPQTLEKKIREKIEQLGYDTAALQALNAMLREKIPNLVFGSKPIQVEWGHADDWAAGEALVTAEGFTAEALRQQVGSNHYGPRGEILEGFRSYVFWLLARTDEELEQFQQTAQRVVDEAFPGDFPVPVVVVLPDRPQERVINAFQRLRAMEKFSNSEREEAGPEMLKHAQAGSQADLLAGLTAVRGDSAQPFDVVRDTSSYVVPNTYRTRVQVAPRIPLKSLLRESYEWAYPFRPPVFDTRYRAAAQGGGKLKGAVTKIATHLINGRSRSLPDLAVGGDAAMMRDVYGNYLRAGWKLLQSDYSLQPPPAPGLRRAWDTLDKAFEPGTPGSRLSTVLSILLAPPFGFDYNTALLLFAGWVGYYGSDVRVSQVGRLVKVSVFNDALTRSAKEFFKQVYDNKITLERRDPSENEQAVRSLLAGLRGRPLDQQQALNHLEELRGVAEDERMDARLRDEVAGAVKQLQQALDAAHKYDNDAAAISKAMPTADLRRLLELRRKVGALEPVEMVQPQAPPPAALQTTMDEAIDRQVHRLAAEYSALDDLNAYQWHLRQLQESRKALSEAGLTEPLKTLDEALLRLDEREKALRAIMQEQPTRDMIALMRIDVPLAALYAQRDTLHGLEGFSESTMALRDKKVAQTTAEIARLEQEARTLPAQILNTPDQKSLRGLLERVIRIGDRYEGTPAAEQIQAATSLIDRYGSFLLRLHDLRGAIPNLRGPEDATRLLATIDELEADGKPWMGEQQQQMLADARQRVESQVAAKRKTAADWFQQIEVEARSNGNPVRLLEKLQVAPPFLTNDQRSRIQQLSLQAERQIEQDVVAQIERQFRKIGDPQLRQSCIARLQQLMQEPQS